MVQSGPEWLTKTRATLPWVRDVATIQAGRPACPGHNTAAVWRVWATYYLQMELLRDKTDLLPLTQGALEPDVSALDSGAGSPLSLAVGAASRSSS